MYCTSIQCEFKECCFNSCRDFWAKFKIRMRSNETDWGLSLRWFFTLSQCSIVFPWNRNAPNWFLLFLWCWTEVRLSFSNWLNRWGVRVRGVHPQRKKDVVVRARGTPGLRGDLQMVRRHSRCGNTVQWDIYILLCLNKYGFMLILGWHCWSVE